MTDFVNRSARDREFGAFVGPPKSILVKKPDGTVLGPIWKNDYDELLEVPGITEQSPAFVEGMPRWLTLRDAFGWAIASFLTPHRDKIIPAIRKFEERQMTLREIYDYVYTIVNRFGAMHGPRASDGIISALQINSWLIYHIRNHNQSLKLHPLAEFPAVEMGVYRISKQLPRWRVIWQQSGGRFYEDRMIARRDSPIWKQVSEFGFPCLPFSLDREEKTRPISRSEALRLGVIGESDEIATMEELHYSPVLF